MDGKNWITVRLFLCCCCVVVSSRCRVISDLTINDPIEFVLEDRCMTISIGHNCMCVYSTRPDVNKQLRTNRKYIRIPDPGKVSS